MKTLIQKAEHLFRNNLPKSRNKEVYIIHVELVRKYALILAKEYNADSLVLEVAALLHDIGADAGKVHAFKSEDMAKIFLENEDVPKDTKEKILSAIRNHSMGKSSTNFKESVPLEDQLLRDADGIAFLEDTFKWYFEKGLELNSTKEEARKVSLEKIQGMLDKIKTEKGKKLANKFYPIAKKYILNI